MKTFDKDNAIKLLSKILKKMRNMPAGSITQQDITNWNNKTSNIGTVTGVKINNTTKSPTNGIVDLGTVITAHQDISGKANSSDLATVATSGNYNDLSNKPASLPANGGTAENVSGTVAISHGGTGATTAAVARTNLGVEPTITIVTNRPIQKGSNNSLILKADNDTEVTTIVGEDDTDNAWDHARSSAIPTIGLVQTKVSAVEQKASGKYSKPSGGIPKSDLASTVQSSLDKADSALQSHQDISGKADKSATVSTVTYDTTNKKIIKTINGTTTDVVTAAKIVSDAKGIVNNGNTEEGEIAGGTEATSYKSSNDTNHTRVHCSPAAVTIDTTHAYTSGDIYLNTKSGGKVNINGSEVAVKSDIPSIPNISKGTTTGSGNAVTDITVSGHTVTLKKETTFLTQHQDISGKVNVSSIGVANGVASLDASGKVPSSQLPSYVDDVLEYATKSNFPATGESGKIYIDLATNKTYRWGGSAYGEISESLALGETSSTAFAGNRGKAVENKLSGIASGATKVEASSTNGNIKINGTETTVYTHPGSGTNPHGTTASDVGLGNVINTGDSATPVSGGTTKFTTGGAYTELNKKVDKTRTIAGLDLQDNITKAELQSAIDDSTHRFVTDTEKSTWNNKVSANNSTITIQKNGTTVDSFTTNASSPKTININTADDLKVKNNATSSLVSDSFLFRQTANGTAGVDNGFARIEKLKGNTVVWTQYITSDKVNSAESYNPSVTQVSVSNGEISVKTIANGSAQYERGFKLAPFNNIGNIVGHKYLIMCLTKASVQYGYASDSSLMGVSSSFTIQNYIADKWCKTTAFVTASNANNTFILRVTSQPAINSYFYFKNFQLFDLTLMFGAGNEPTTVAEFEAMFPEPYYAYDAGRLLSFNPAGLKTVGFNLWDEEWEVGYIDVDTGIKNKATTNIRSKNYIPVLSNTAYIAKCPVSIQIFLYDSNKNFITHFTVRNSVEPFNTQNAKYILFYPWGAYGDGATTYNHDICINFSNASKNGTYEAHWENTCPIDITTLKGRATGSTTDVVMFPDGLCSAGSVYDEIDLKSGRAVKRLGKVDLGSLTWSKSGETFYSSQIGTWKGGSDYYVCGKYTTEGYGNNPSVQYGLYSSDRRLYVKDPNYSTAAAFITAMSGVYLYYELATPIEYTFEPISDTYPIDALGTEEIVFNSGTAPTTVPALMDIRYSTNVINTVKNLPNVYVSAVQEQAFSEEEKELARKNIGAVSVKTITETDEEDTKYIDIINNHASKDTNVSIESSADMSGSISTVSILSKSTYPSVYIATATGDSDNSAELVLNKENITLNTTGTGKVTISGECVAGSISTTGNISATSGIVSSKQLDLTYDSVISEASNYPIRINNTYNGNFARFIATDSNEEYIVNLSVDSDGLCILPGGNCSNALWVGGSCYIDADIDVSGKVTCDKLVAAVRPPYIISVGNAFSAMNAGHSTVTNDSDITDIRANDFVMDKNYLMRRVVLYNSTTKEITCYGTGITWN